MVHVSAFERPQFFPHYHTRTHYIVYFPLNSNYDVASETYAKHFNACRKSALTSNDITIHIILEDIIHESAYIFGCIPRMKRIHAMKQKNKIIQAISRCFAPSTTISTVFYTSDYNQISQVYTRVHHYRLLNY
jgi:hypothetical protein